MILIFIQGQHFFFENLGMPATAERVCIAFKMLKIIFYGIIAGDLDSELSWQPPCAFGTGHKVNNLYKIMTQLPS